MLTLHHEVPLKFQMKLSVEETYLLILLITYIFPSLFVTSKELFAAK
jgi:hypothetical protein